MANMGQPVVTVAQDCKDLLKLLSFFTSLNCEFCVISVAFLRALIDLTKTRSTVPSEIEAQYRRYYNERIGALVSIAIDNT